MSADRQLLKSAIQRIAKEDPEIRNLLGEGQNKGGQPSASGVGTSEAEESRLCCDGSTSSNRNPGSETRDPSESAKDGLDPGDPANISDNLTGVTDCATGTPICFEGSDWIPPEGWEDAQEPPLDPTYREDIYALVIANNVTTYYRTCQQARNAYRAHFAGCLDVNPASCEDLSPGGKGSTSANCGDGTTRSANWGLLSCSDENPICDEPQPTVGDWPEDDCVNLAIKGGKLVGSKYDPENDGSYSAPRDQIELCDLENGTRTLVRADTGSTWKSIKSLDGDIDPDTGYGYLYDAASGKKIRQISPSEFRDDTV